MEIRNSIGCMAAFVVIAIIVGGIALLMWWLPQYGVWKNELKGKAQLKEAEYSKQVQIEEAKANLEAEKLSGQKLTQYLTKANAANAQKVLDLTHKTVGNLVKHELTLSRLSFSINTDRLQN